MKINEIYKELLELAKSEGIAIRKDKGRFQSGFCKIDGQETILLNSNSPIQLSISALANALNEHTISDIYIKPAIREYLEGEIFTSNQANKFNLKIEY
jgi:hypothetical protein